MSYCNLVLVSKRRQSLTGCIFLTPAWLLMRCHCFLWLADEHSLAKAYTLPSSGFTQQFLSPTLIALSGTMCIPAPDSGTKPYAIHRSVSRREEILARVLYHHSSSIIHPAIHRSMIALVELSMTVRWTSSHWRSFSRSRISRFDDVVIIYQVSTNNHSQKRNYYFWMRLLGIVSTTGNCDDVSARWCSTGVGWSIGHCGSSLGVTSSLTFDWQLVFEGRVERKSENLEVSKTQSIISASPPSTLVGNLQIESNFVVCLVVACWVFFLPGTWWSF